jgi:hypothetical protein
MTRHPLTIGMMLTVALLAYAPMTARAAVIVKYEYDTVNYLPTSQGWNLNLHSGTVSNNTGDSALQVTDANSEAYGPGVDKGLSPTDYSAGWTLTARVRVDSGNNAVATVFALSTATNFWNVLFLPGSNQVQTISDVDGYANLGSPVSTMTTAFHTYQLVGNGDNAPELWIDGTATGGFARTYAGFGGTPSVQWGTLMFSGGSEGVANWQLVQFETPEPASLGLLGLGGLALLRRRR